MSEVQPDAGEQSKENVAAKTAKGTNPLRLVILLLIFGIALIGLLYDYSIARPAHKEAYETVDAMLADKNPDPDSDGTVSDDKVQSELGRKPSKTELLSNGKIEIYSWRSGLPYRTYDVYVVYVGQKMPLLYFVSTDRPTSTELPPKAVIPKPSQDDIDNDVPRNPSPGPGMPGGGRGKGSGGRKGTRKPGESPAQKQDAQQEEPSKSETEEPAKEEPAKEEPAKEAARNADPPAKEEGGE